jgi:hypothetical protein
LNFFRGEQGIGEVRTDSAGFTSNDRNSGVIQQRPRIDPDAAGDEFVDAQTNQRLRGPDAGTAWR